MSGNSPHHLISGVIIDPRKSDILRGLSAMEPPEQAATMIEMSRCFCLLSGNSQWREHIAEQCAGMGERELARIEKRSERIAARLRRSLQDATGVGLAAF